MIEECESLLPQFLINKYYQDWFPKWIIIRKGREGQSIDGVDDQWQGFVKQMKNHFDKETRIMKAEFEKQKSSIIHVIEKKHDLTTAAIKRAMEEAKEAKEAVKKLDNKMDQILE